MLVTGPTITDFSPKNFVNRIANRTCGRPTGNVTAPNFAATSGNSGHGRRNVPLLNFLFPSSSLVRP